MKKRLNITIAALLFITASAAYALEAPALKGRLNDYGDMISPAAESSIEQKLASFEASDSTQVVILTINSLDGDAMEDFTIRVAEKWKIGQAKKDNGVILFASKNDRRLRIEVGRGLEGVLTDLLAGRILDTVIRPKFQAGDFDGGFTDGIDAIINACRGEFTSDGFASSARNDGNYSDFIIILFFGFLYFVRMVTKKSKILSGLGGAVAIPIWVHNAFMPLGLTGIIIAAVSGFIFGLVNSYILLIGGNTGRGSGGGSSFGGFSGGGSSFGGFSGGGGSFGGGGSSGGW